MLGYPELTSITHLLSTIKDWKERKRPSTPAADPNQECYAQVIWWQRDVQLNALPCYKLPIEGMWLICPIDFQHITVSLKARQIETRSAWHSRVSSGFFYTVILNLLFMLYFISPVNEELVLFYPHCLRMKKFDYIK